VALKFWGRSVIMGKVKFVLVMRDDLNMRKGKMAAQGIHAVTPFLVRHIREAKPLNQVEDRWTDTGETAICLGVDSEQELLDIYEKAKAARLNVHLVRDAGRTEFHGQPTFTCLGIGPDNASKIDPITGHLRPL
jgi:peptidyl-tRNA hydrolase, PTH2 family